ncbi:ROK family transcriptional regulator [Pradoshia sp. D12]|uniref:ROK family transcriptional regulator n=1 Tax=Bacillaceae TaxID=186817 RepID=UPI00112C16A7|nr:MULTISPECIES: ROK family transcriptional regulator [Bacillaceae]QFK71964.1 ROK family transcriptional regulator [Pradoshia sp. D12]TPF71544.1 ROK family transcriptional regulator [Bacillus sp. D12]
MRVKDQYFLKRQNQSLVLEYIIQNGPISRAEIAKHTAMSPTSASRIVASLQEEQLIKEVYLETDEVGRKATYFMANENSVVFVGVEIDVGIVRAGLMNLIGELIVVRSFQTKTEHYEHVVEFIGQMVNDLISEQQIEKVRIAGVCIGLPGLIDNEKGTLEFSAQFSWRNVPLKQMLEQKLDLKVFIDNELKLKALAEYVSASLPYKNVVMLGFGKGVGSALITDGEIYRGTNNMSGEIGHMTLDPYGTYCPCGNFGCLQTYIATDFLLDEASKTQPMNSMDELAEAYRKKEKWAVNILEKAATYAGLAIKNVVCAYNPDAVFLSGTLIEDYPEIAELIIEKHSNSAWFPESYSYELLVTQMKEIGVVKGAALSVQRKLIKNLNFKGDF